jgi:hypothetical protein
MNSGPIRPWVRILNTAFAVALAAFVLGNYWPIVKLFDLSRADLQYQGEWVGGHAKRITAVTPGGVVERAGLKPGDVLEFDPSRDSDWVLASYRHMPEGFSATLPVRRSDGTRTVVTLEPERVAYLYTLNDRVALLVRLTSLTVMVLVCVAMVWARASLMTWSLSLGLAAAAPFLSAWVPFHLAFKAGTAFSPVAVFVSFIWSWQIALVPFALCFPRDTLTDWPRWKRALGLTFAVVLNAYVAAALYPEPFERDLGDRRSVLIIIAVATVSLLGGLAALARTYRRSNGEDQARLKWAMLGMAVSFLGFFISLMTAVARSVIPSVLSGSEFTQHNYVAALCGVLFALSLGYAVLRQRVVDVQFAISRTLVFGVVSTLALVFLAAVHWLLGRLLEHSGMAFGIEGIAAIGLGVVLHRASHGINLVVDRVLFRKHHRAEERLRRVTAALPFASDERAIAEALVTEPARHLELASAALFYRDSPEGPLTRVLAQGWGEEHPASLDPDFLMVRYLQAEHEPLKLDDSQLLPAGIPDGAALPVLAIPIVNQHVLAAVVLYGAHTNHTLLDPDEIDLLHALAQAAATSHQQVRIAMLQRENATLTSEKTVEKARNEQLEASLRVLAQQRPALERGNTT